MLNRISTNTLALFSVDAGLYRAGNRGWLIAAITGLVCYTLFKLSFVKLSQLGEGVLLIAFIVALFNSPRASRRDPVLLYLYLSLAISFMVYVLTKFQVPDYAMQYPRLDQLSRPALILVVAWWLGGEVHNVLRLYALAFAGLLLGIIYHFDLQDFQLGISEGGRLDYGIRNAGHTAAYLGTVLIGWVAFSGYLLKGARGSMLWLRVGLWGGLLLWMLWSLLMTQTRAAWLGLGLSVAIISPFYLYRLSATLERTQLVKIKLAVLGLTACLLLVVLSQGIHERVATRISKEMDTVATAMRGDFENIRMDSIGVRLNQWIEASHWIAQRPLTGWGDVGRSAVIDESRRFDEEFKAQYGHFHSSLVEVLLIYGVTGLLAVVALFGWIYLSLWRCWREGVLPDPFFFFSLAFAVFWVTVNLFESFFIFSTGAYINAIVLGGLYSFSLKQRQRMNVGAE